MSRPASSLDQTALLIMHAASAASRNEKFDIRPAIVRSVASWNRELDPNAVVERSADAPQRSAAVRRFYLAAYRALRTYPGPAGELIHRELLAAAEFGHRIGAGGPTPHAALLHRLADEVLAAAPVRPMSEPR